MTQQLKGTFTKLSEDLKETMRERDSLAKSYANLQKEAEEVSYGCRHLYASTLSIAMTWAWA